MSALRSSRRQAIRKAYDIGWKPVQYLNNVSSSIGAVLTPAGLGEVGGHHHQPPISKDYSDAQ